MVPMFDPMVPEATLLFTVMPSLVGVMTAFAVAVAGMIVGTMRELRRGEAPRPSAASSPVVRHDAALRVA